MNFNNAHEALKQKEVTIHPKKKQDQRTQLILLHGVTRPTIVIFSQLFS